MSIAKDDCWIYTYSGKKFKFFDPDESMICFEDFSHALSMNCRFGCHCESFYSVAQHSVLAADLVRKYEPDNIIAQKVALMHDVPEAWIGDLPKPLKMAIIDAIGPIEQSIWEVTASKYELPVKFPPIVKRVDREICLVEKNQIMSPSPRWPGETDEVIEALPDINVTPLPPADAKALFAWKFEEMFDRQKP